MFFDPATILAALLPAVADGIKRLIGKWTGGPNPQSVDELVRLGELDIRRLEALAQLDTPTGITSQWVANIRALQRPIAVGIVLLAWVGVMFMFTTNEMVVSLVSNLASSVIFYLFGDRTMMYLNNKKDGNK